ncbi:MFS transporter, partial [Aeromonas jandaei]
MEERQGQAALRVLVMTVTRPVEGFRLPSPVLATLLLELAQGM